VRIPGVDGRHLEETLRQILERSDRHGMRDRFSPASPQEFRPPSRVTTTPAHGEVMNPAGSHSRLRGIAYEGY
jgi:hypothetical protein